MDALYTHIFSQSPNPVLAAWWIVGISDSSDDLSAFCLRHILQEEVGQASYLLENLSSLLWVPPVDNFKAKYKLYHKSLVDFLSDSSRCGAEYSNAYLLERFVRILLDKYPVGLVSDAHLPIFWAQFLEMMPDFLWNRIVLDPTCTEHYFPLLMECDVAGWIEIAFSTLQIEELESFFPDLYQSVHCIMECMSGCSELCKRWRGIIHSILPARGWSVPDASFLLREVMYHVTEHDSETEPFLAEAPYFTCLPHGLPHTPTSSTDYNTILSLANEMYERLHETWEDDYEEEMEEEGVTEYNIFGPLIASIERELGIVSSSSTWLENSPDAVSPTDPDMTVDSASP
ncbi:hypothetical protein NMY22_g12770 [Coprinellus aureogranulatus]|nr:hypothetical protein NMY22_g12770 [Coprinellus aureogranulatus]